LLFVANRRAKYFLLRKAARPDPEAVVGSKPAPAFSTAALLALTHLLAHDTRLRLEAEAKKGETKKNRSSRGAKKNPVPAALS
jgi:hypothetical protein